MSMLENYLLYLKFLESKLVKFFASQKPFIFCHKGCSKCCKNAEFPFSEIEVKFLMYGFAQLSEETKKKILENIRKVNEEKKNFKGENFMYDCPFLIDEVCSVYNFRGIICRTFGLMYNGADGKVKVPFCCYQGMNYSNVIDPETRKISQEKVDKRGFKEEPASFNLSYKFLTDPDFEKGFKFKFGDKKPLIDWFSEE